MPIHCISTDYKSALSGSQHKVFYQISDVNNLKRMKKYLIIFIFSISFLLSNCSTRQKYLTIKEIESEGYVEVIKFMGTITTQPYSVDEKIFWNNRDEHAKLIIRNNDFIEDIKTLNDTTSKNFREYNYAFIVRKGKEIDTLYSDYTLKTWILKKDKKETYYFDEKGETAENLRHMYSFFNECW